MYLYKGTVSRGTELPGLLPALRPGVTVGHHPGLQGALLDRPHLSILLHVDSGADRVLLLHLVGLLLGVADGVVHDPADLGDVISLAVRHQRGGALLNHLSHGLLLVRYDTDLPEIFIALLLLMGLVRGDEGVVALLGVAVDTRVHLRVLKQVGEKLQ